MRVAFSLIGGKKWTGGIHYLKNLLAVLHEHARNEITPLIFSGENTPDKDIDLIRPFIADIVRDKSLAPWTALWIVRQLTRRILDNDPVIARLFKRYDVEAVFRFGLTGKRFPFPCVNWIEDFQHFRMPGMFSAKEIRVRNRLYRETARTSTRLMVSSESARDDFHECYPDYKGDIDVLRFVVRIPQGVYDELPWNTIRKYRVPEKFFHIPNQFWKHKNHAAVLEAVKILKSQKKDIFVICTGNPVDYRNPGHFEFLKEKCHEYGINDHISFLGMVPFDHLYAFMRQSVAIMNPSLFEGWSTTVEEAKSLGKEILLSDIPVHREQSPPGATYFDPNDPVDLAEKMLSVWKETAPGPDLLMEGKARSVMNQRTKAFAYEFVDIVKKAVSDKVSNLDRT